ncbi:protein mono-ADP-ribosyltransferase PARP14-like [Argopecten irradians]|uniref:protein mono-ADP-ribosyltransferase PARP14-like n=1 Tax=Argopecten irradians TaxID=31199 RepID=UPI00371B26A9
MAMDMAESRSCKSLAFPALGTGIGSKPEDIASAFVEALVDFERNHPDDVKEVRMVVYQQDMIQKILSAMQMTFQTYKQSKGYLKQLKDYVTGSGGGTKKNQWSPRFNKISANAYSFAVMVYGKDQRVINMAISDLEGKLDETLMRKIIEDDIIKTFTGSQESQLDNMREKLQIDVTVEKRIGRIQLLGLPDAISNAVDIVHRLMLEAQRHQQAKQEAQLISDMVQWYYIEVTSDGEDLQKYDAIVNRKLEKGHRDGLNER